MDTWGKENNDPELNSNLAVFFSRIRAIDPYLVFSEWFGFIEHEQQILNAKKHTLYACCECQGQKV